MLQSDSVTAHTVQPFQEVPEVLDLGLDEGYKVRGFESDNGFAGVISVGRLLRLVDDPMLVESVGVARVTNRFAPILALRKLLQRVLEGTKRRNVGSYADFLKQVVSGKRIGTFPPIIFWTQEELEVVGQVYLQIPEEAILVAIDGDTQLSAWFRLTGMLEEDPSLLRQVKRMNIPIVIHHGRSIEWARQSFHDLNVLGVAVNAAIALSMDEYDTGTMLARELESNIPALKGRVNKVRRQLRLSDKEIVTLPQLRNAAITFALGIQGIKYGSKSVTDEIDVHTVGPLAISWFTRVFDIIEPQLDSGDGRRSTVCAAPSVLAALGAMGHAMLDPDDTEYEGSGLSPEKVLERQVAKLATVDWKRPTWLNVGVKRTASGGYSIAGAKEAAYTAYRALNDPSALVQVLDPDDPKIVLETIDAYQQVRPSA